MSTKRLARTVIEGGRDGWSKFSRRASHRKERARLRSFLTEAMRDPERLDEVEPPRRPHVYKHFDDKLSAAERWLRSRVGTPWAKVEGEILATFDTRSLAGRHIVFDHLLPREWESPVTGWRVHRRGTFFVDDGGVLRFDQKTRVRRKPKTTGDLADFVGVRSIARRGERLYWLVPTRHQSDPPSEPMNRRQDRELSAAERERYDALSDTERAACTIVFD